MAILANVVAHHAKRGLAPPYACGTYFLPARSGRNERADFRDLLVQLKDTASNDAEVKG